MVRAIVGSLVNVGRGKWPVDAMTRIVDSKDRLQAGETAPPQGLFLVSVTYPSRDSSAGLP
jgi:tRNA pseudouridine38-40 synthase